MKDWEIALNKFVEEWKNKPEVTGIIVCGSYIIGNPTKSSDIDIQIILKKGCKWRERGNKIINGILIEYFANPPEKIISYFQEDQKIRKKTAAHMIATGKIILDKEGEANKLKAIAIKYLNKKFDKISNSKIELSKYHIFDMIDNLKEVSNRNLGDFQYVYYNFLRNVLEIYTEFLGAPSYHEHKTLRLLIDKQDRKKYNISELEDKKFVKLFIKAIKEKSEKKMLEDFIIISKHVQNKMRGFNIDGWKFRSSSK